MAEKDWEDFGWQGLRLQRAKRLEFRRVDGDAERATHVWIDAEIVRARSNGAS